MEPLIASIGFRYGRAHMEEAGVSEFAREWTIPVATGLRFEVTTAYESPIFEQFFTGYDRAFILPSEKEDTEGFRDCLALNHGPEHQRLLSQFGPFVELCIAIRDAESGAFIGGANLLAVLFAGLDGRPVVTSNLNYVYVETAARGKGYLKRIIAGIFELVSGLFPQARGAAPLIFIEQNDPLKMDPEAYRADTEHAGIDQFDRLLVWAKAGAWLVDFPYIQPGLSEDQGPDETLVYAILSPPGPRLDPAILAGHLERFFAISVLKGRDGRGEEIIASQERELRRRAAEHEFIHLIDPKPLLVELAGRSDRWSHWRERPLSLIEAARAYQPAG